MEKDDKDEKLHQKASVLSVVLARVLLDNNQRKRVNSPNNEGKELYDFKGVKFPLLFVLAKISNEKANNLEKA